MKIAERRLPCSSQTSNRSTLPLGVSMLISNEPVCPTAAAGWAISMVGPGMRPAKNQAPPAPSAKSKRSIRNLLKRRISAICS